VRHDKSLARSAFYALHGHTVSERRVVAVLPAFFRAGDFTLLRDSHAIVERFYRRDVVMDFHNESPNLILYQIHNV
jgi:hypothetical protein